MPAKGPDVPHGQDKGGPTEFPPMGAFSQASLLQAVDKEQHGPHEEEMGDLMGDKPLGGRVFLKGPSRRKGKKKDNCREQKVFRDPQRRPRVFLSDLNVQVSDVSSP